MERFRFFPALLSLLFSALPPAANAQEPIFGASHYKIKVFIFSEPGFLPETAKNSFAETVIDRCRLQFGTLYDLSLEFPTDTTPSTLKERLAAPPPEWEPLDKVFIAEFTDSQNLRMIENDLKTRFSGRERIYEIDNPAKAVDVFLNALLGQISPLAKMEKATTDTATFQIKGADIASALRKSGPTEIRSLAGIDVDHVILLPFVRSMDRNDKLIGVAPVPWTVLVPERIDPITNRLHCRVESASRSSLGSSRRGRTEVFALSVPTPMLPTMLKFRARMEFQAADKNVATLHTLPIYEVFEVTPGGKKPISIGRTQTDGVFLLEPLEDRPLRVLLIRSGQTLIARVPVVRGLESELVVPIPDDSVRLEAEGVILGLQEEMIDVAAHRSILRKRLEKYKSEKNDAMVRETEGAINRLKDGDRFLIELEQAKLRYRSDDPVVQRRIDKLFRDTRRALRNR